MDGVYRRLPGASISNETPCSPLASSNSCCLPTELQMIILEVADWKLHPILAQVCRFWRHFIQNSAQVRLNRYFPVQATTYGFDSSPGEAEYPRPRPWVHKSLTYLRQFIVDTNAPNPSLRPCKVELLQWPPPPRPSCRIWPDMHWGIFKDDPVTIFPGIDSNSLKIAEREIVVSFYCCDYCESREDKKNQVVPLGPVAKVASYLSFVTKQVNYEMARCLKNNLKMEKKWYEDFVVEFWMGREPILVFSPGGYDTDTLRLWFEAKVRQCDIDWF
ncbi:hypothetical protein TWF281_007901 [Arthrobotrys megalospora]